MVFLALLWGGEGRAQCSAVDPLTGIVLQVSGFGGDQPGFVLWFRDSEGRTEFQTYTLDAPGSFPDVEDVSLVDRRGGYFAVLYRLRQDLADEGSFWILKLDPTSREVLGAPRPATPEEFEQFKPTLVTGSGDLVLFAGFCVLRERDFLEICGLKADDDLEPVGPVVPLSDPDDGKESTEPAAVATSEGELFVAWLDEVNDEYSLRMQQLDEDLGPVRGSTWEPPAWMKNLRDLTLFCFPDAANPDPESRSACTTESPLFGAFAFDEGPDTPKTERTSEGSGYEIVWFDPVTFEVIATQRGGPQNLTGPVRFYGIEGVCNPWARTCGVGFNAETLDGLFSYGGKVTFTLFNPPPPRGVDPRPGRHAAASAAGASPALVVSEPFIPAEGRDSSVVSLHRSVGFGTTKVEGDFLLTILEEQPEGDSEVLAFPLTAPCVDLERTTCLNDDEFRVHASFNTAAGRSGVGNTVELTSDTGYFWFFDEDNVEVVVKVLDACGVNGYRWVFAAGLTSVAVDLTVKSQSGEVREYRNPLDVPYQPVLDTTAFPCTEGEVRRAREEEWAARPFEEIDEALERLAARSGDPLRREGAAGACAASDETLCLTADRFRVGATFRTQDGNEGTARTVELTSDTGYFWFFDEDNVEVVLKVLDACALNDNFWLFAAGLTNVEVEITVTDTVLGTERTFANPLGTPFAPIQETSVLPCG